MLFLFNSGYRKEYIQNVHRTLFYPNGWLNEYRYRFTGNRINVAPGSKQFFKNLPKDTEVLITYIDRWGMINGKESSKYVFYPIRRGKLTSCQAKSGRLYFRVVLEDFIYPYNFEEFNRICNSLRGGPKYSGNPQNADDGYYAIKEDSFYLDPKMFKIGEDAWLDIVRGLRNTYFFNPFRSIGEDGNFDETLKVLFGKVELFEKEIDGNKLLPKVFGDSVYYEIRRDRAYFLVLEYEYPYQNERDISFMELKTGPGIILQKPSRQLIDNTLSRKSIEFSPKKNLEESKDNIHFEFFGEENVKISAPNETITFRIIEGKRFWYQAFFAVIIFTFSGILISLELEEGQNLYQIFSQNVTPLKILGGIAQAITLIWLFKLVGKKIVG